MNAFKRALSTLAVFILVFTIIYSPVSGQYTREKAKLNGIFFDYGIDEDHNGLYEAIAINVGISVFSPGNYTLRGSLYNSNGSEIITAYNQSYLDNKNSFIRNTYMELKFYGAEVSGPRYLRNLSFYDSSGDLLSQLGNAYLTRSYDHLENVPTSKEYVQPANLTGYFKDYGTDTNGDQLYDFLTIDVGIDVQTPGEYTLDGSIYDTVGNEVVWSLDHKNLSAGYHIMRLNFDGKTIARHRVNGPYYLGGLELYSGSSDVGFIPYIIDVQKYATSAYKYADFEDRVSS